MQKLQSQVTIKIPKEFVLVKAAEYKELKEKAKEEPVIWTKQQAREYMGLSLSKFSSFIYEPEIRKQLDFENDGCVIYPANKQDHYVIYTEEFKKFVNTHKREVMNALK